MFVLFAVSVAFRTLLRGKQITVFATVQTTIALLLAAVSLADFGPQAAIVILGVVCLVLSAASYAAVFTVFERAPQRDARCRSAQRRCLCRMGRGAAVWQEVFCACRRCP